jgi:hypothetical protein
MNIWHFRWKYRDIPRDAVGTVVQDFYLFDRDKKGSLTEAEALRLLEHNGLPKTAIELRELVPCEADGTRKITFLDICCVFFEKSFDELNNFSDEASREIALKEARELEMVAIEAENQIKRAKLLEEEAARLRAEEIEKESLLVRAFFHDHIVAFLSFSVTRLVLTYSPTHHVSSVSTDWCSGYEGFLFQEGGRGPGGC